MTAILLLACTAAGIAIYRAIRPALVAVGIV